jgi:hypothetical protein
MRHNAGWIGGAVCAVLMVLYASAGSAAAQQAATGATLRGQVGDARGLGVPGARVVVTQVATGVERESATDREGHFVVPALVPGAVDVVVTASGFAAWRAPRITVEVAQEVYLDVTLAVAGVVEQVDVAADAGAGRIDRATAVVGTVVSAPEIEALPLNGRNFLELAFLTAGSAPAPTFDPTKAQSVVISSAGQLGRGGNITIDGMDNNDDVVGGPLMNVVQDAIQEFQVATNSFSAEYGRSVSSVVNVVTRAGGAAPSGSLSVFLRDQAWQALPATIQDATAGDPPFDRQHVAATFGGPLQPGRLFGFGAVEVRNQDGGVLVGSRNLETRTIDLSYAPAPLDDLLATLRADWVGSTSDVVTFRYSGQRQDDISASTLDRAIGAASQRQRSKSRMQAVLATWTRTLSPRAVNTFSASVSDFDNAIEPVAPGVQLTFPSIQDGSSFRVPQATLQRRFQVANAVSWLRGAHNLKVGGQVQRIDAAFDLGVFREGRIEFVEDFAPFDRNGDGRVDDNDLLFAVTLRSGRPGRDLELPDADNIYVAAYVQDDWRVTPRFTVNLGVRYEVDTDVNNISRVDELNPIVAPFVNGNRRRDLDNLAPRVGFNWVTEDALTSVRGGFGVYYDRITLQISSLERGLDGRALPVEVRAGNVFFVDQETGTVPPAAPSLANPFTGFILPGEGASGINIIDSRLQNPRTRQMSIGIQRQLGATTVLRADVIHNRGDQFIIGRTVGEVFNPVVGGADRVVNLESSARTQYSALLVEFERRYAGRYGARAAYTLSEARNHANDDQIPFGSGPIDPDDIEREWANTPNDRRHRLVLSGMVDLGSGFQLSGVWTISSGVPMDILMPDGQSRVPTLPRNAGGRRFGTADELNAYITELNAAGGVGGELLPLVGSGARFNDAFSAVDLRLSKRLSVGPLRIDGYLEVFNVLDTENILGTGTVNYSGFANALVRDSNDPADPGYLSSSSFGRPVSTAGGFFGTGGARAMQLGARLTF